jgi:hypothetical protein
MTTQRSTYEAVGEPIDDEARRSGMLLGIRPDGERDALLTALDPVHTPAPTGPASIFPMNERRQYNPLKSAYKGGTDQLFVTYEIDGLDGHSSDEDSYPQVTRVYLSGDLCDWEIGTFRTRSGAEVFGVKIEYQQTHERYRVRDAHEVYEDAANGRRYTKIIEIPAQATNIELRSELPDRYRHALHIPY